VAVLNQSHGHGTNTRQGQRSTMCDVPGHRRTKYKIESQCTNTGLTVTPHTTIVSTIPPAYVYQNSRMLRLIITKYREELQVWNVQSSDRSDTHDTFILATQTACGCDRL